MTRSKNLYGQLEKDVINQKEVTQVVNKKSSSNYRIFEKLLLFHYIHESCWSLDFFVWGKYAFLYEFQKV